MSRSMIINEYDIELTEDQSRMRRHLRYHFMNPKEKWQAKGTLPFKMMLIIVKLVLITIQVIVFSQNNSNQVIFTEGSKTSFMHLFLKDWSSAYETLPYPPSNGLFAIYDIKSLYETVNYALTSYYNVKNQSLGPYSFGINNKPRMSLCIEEYKIVSISPSNSTYVFSSEVIKHCIDIVPMEVNSTTVFDVKTYLQSQNFTINLNGLIKAWVNFTLRSIQLKSFEIDELPDCFEFKLKIKFDNSFHNGQMLINFHMIMKELVCKSKPLIKVTTGLLMRNSLIALDTFVILLSACSLVLCCRSITRLYQFWKKAKNFFVAEMGVDIINKRHYFWNISYFIILIGDLFVLTGTIIKLQMFQRFQREMTNFELCNYFLGLGLFFGYLTLLRYFSYFPKSSILINTIRVAIPPLLRFSLCSIILYMAFALLGWIILGPYHLKFRTFENSLACLFSLMMGDDMYVTLSVIQKENSRIYLFSQLYIYCFLILFIFVVLNLILTIIIEAYDEVKNHEKKASQIDPFWSFINSCPDTSKSHLYHCDTLHEKSLKIQKHSEVARKFVDIACCCIGHENNLSEIESFPEVLEDIVCDDTSESICNGTNDYNTFGVKNRNQMLNHKNHSVLSQLRAVSI